MITLKTPEELKIMQESGKICSAALKEVLKNVKAGVKTIELDKIAEKFIADRNALPSFKTVEDYKFTTCININEGLVHGIPNDRVIKKGDLVKVDLGVLYKGFHTDLSYTVEIETTKEEVFLKTGKEAVEEAIKKCVPGGRLGDISHAIQQIIEDGGYTVSRQLVGHGIGRSLHEDPYVSGYGKPETGPYLKEGMVFAIEVIYQKGRPAIAEEADGWTIITRDRSLAALFEQTVAITSNGPLILTNY